MKWFKKLASGAMAAAMVMLCAPTVVNAEAAANHIEVSSVSVTGINDSIAKAVAGMKPSFSGKTGTITGDTSNTNIDKVEFGELESNLTFYERWQCLDSTVSTANKSINSAEVNTSEFHFIAGKQYMYRANAVLKIKSGNTDYAFADDHDMASALKGIDPTTNFLKTVIADGKPLDWVNSTTIKSGAIDEGKLCYSAEVVDTSSTSDYDSATVIRLYFAYKVTIPAIKVDVSEVDFTGINTALASAKAGKQPTFGASESATINPSDRISSVNHFNEYWIDIKDTTKSISSSEDEKSSTFTFEAGHSYCYYVVRDFRATKNKEDEYVLKAAYDLKGDNTAGYLRTLKSSEITIKRMKYHCH